MCPHCRALERHRLLWLFLGKHTDLFDGRQKKLLHIAPEFCLEPGLKKAAGKGYLSADLDESRAMVRMDITSIDFPDVSFDVIFCSHVLEHIEDDRKAIGEIYRVLKKNGWAILMVPVTADKTIENLSFATPEERLQVFGQQDHVRRYGPDYADRLREAGFEVRTACAGDLASAAELEKMGLAGCPDTIFHSVKTS
ncbi:MAG: methyltransferase domain-containing protein [Chlorobiaceae bacterium]|nr:methyltransferase domain-containing protein [Chlorobiaceae bacterium]NTV60705.1 methyltransferase domain-containing protein [Chlorobiaceae bacterium]